ncbi:MAG: DUF4974 domain-containing protein [Tannerellaceae bacterium]|nr:DUF4974 domain-containing protein [Tannerellaceae bacterium]
MNHRDTLHIDEINTELLVRYLRGQVSPNEKRSIEEWINRNPENEKLACQIGQIYYAQYTRKRMESYNPYLAYEKNRRRRKNKSVIKRIKYAGMVAACITVIIFLAIPFIYTGKAKPVETQYMTVYTNPGIRTSFNLPDGTFVCLNSASNLVYPIPYDPKERNVRLEGEAYFEVKSDKNHPFVVSVADDKMHVKVTGTSFNVTAYPDENEIHTTLIEGIVDICVMEEGGTMGQYTLEPSNKASFNIETGKVMIKTVVPEYEYAWKEGKLIFRDAPIPEVLQKMSYYYNVKFEVKDPVIETYRFNGTFKDKQLSQVLDYLAHTNKLKYTIKTIEEENSDIKSTIIIVERKIVSNP